MGEEIDYPVYGKLYEKLSELNGKTMPIGELYRYIENLKFNFADFDIGTLQKEVMQSLLRIGFTKRQSQKLSKRCGAFAQYLRFSRRDTMEMVRAMHNLGYLQIEKRHVKIRRD